MNPLFCLSLCRYAAEVECLRRANAGSGEAHAAMWRACAPGVKEYELEAVFVAETMRRGLRELGYPCIVGAGRNAVEGGGAG